MHHKTVLRWRLGWPPWQLRHLLYLPKGCTLASHSAFSVKPEKELVVWLKKLLAGPSITQSEHCCQGLGRAGNWAGPQQPPQTEDAGRSGCCFKQICSANLSFFLARNRASGSVLIYLRLALSWEDFFLVSWLWHWAWASKTHQQHDINSLTAA